jgi:branched-chain amino acid transport system ATP-binding protein
VLLDLAQRLGTTLVVVEHDLGWAGRLAARMLALDAGRVIVSGRPDAVRSSAAVARAVPGD